MSNKQLKTEGIINELKQGSVFFAKEKEQTEDRTNQRSENRTEERTKFRTEQRTENRSVVLTL